MDDERCPKCDRILRLNPDVSLGIPATDYDRCHAFCDACGIGITNARNPKYRTYVYGDKADWYPTYAARPISAVIDVDVEIPGCPIDREEFIRVVKAVLLGKKPPIPDYPVCVECKKNGNVCVYELGRTCLGPVTRAGCGAICPTYGAGCEGCRGLIPHPNENAMEEVLEEAGLTLDEIMGQFTLFNSYRELEAEA